MTALVPDPIDHWLDLDLTTPRKPLRAEMFTAFDEALDCPLDPPHRRAYWTGVGTGYAVAFGLVTREALDRARRVPGAVTLSDINTWTPGAFADEETAWACGVLFGYWQGTSEHPDADECVTCGQRILRTLDDFQECPDGMFCPDHLDDCHRVFHDNGPSLCAMEGAE